VTCSDAAMRIPRSGWSLSKRARTCRSTGICDSAQSIRAAPPPASDRSATSCGLVAVVVGLVGPIHRDADVGGLLLRELRQLRVDRGEVRTSDLLVEVLGQHVDLLLVLVVLREQLALRDRLV